MKKSVTVKNALIIGSYAKEQIMIQNLKRTNPHLNVFIYMDIMNPGLIEDADDYRCGEMDDLDNITDYIKDKKIDYVLVATAAPLSAGVIDIIEKMGIPCFGPCKAAAHLEDDKSFTRELMEKHHIPGVPEYLIAESPREALEYAENLEWKVAVKPIGLTEGLGVKVYKDQLQTSKDVENYIHELFKENPEEPIIVEEKLEGEEFTLQCFVYDELVLPTPAVQDFKKLKNDDKGPNTGSMGSYSGPGNLLPFMSGKDYEDALLIIRQTLAAFKKDTGSVCKGFLCAQFIITRKGVFLIEYNVRPGDPEWLNIMSVMQNNLLDVVTSLLKRKPVSLSFAPYATVTKYIVPHGYPERDDCILDITLLPEKLNKIRGLQYYFSTHQDKKGRFLPGTERGVVFVGKADSIENANKIVEQAIETVEGEFYYRNDIGTRKMIQKKVKLVSTLKRIQKTEIDKRLVIEKPEQKDFVNVFRFMAQSMPSECYAEHFYKIMLRYFGNTCFVARDSKTIIGFILGFYSQVHPDRYFLWQIAVLPTYQGMGIGKKLTLKMEQHLKKGKCRYIEVTVEPTNIPSQKLFESMGYKNISKKEGETITVNNNCAAKDYYKPGRHFMVYEKKIK